MSVGRPSRRPFPPAQGETSGDGVVHAVDIIGAKRDGAPLPGEWIDWVVDAYTKGMVTEAQMAALAMAIRIHGMDSAETAHWTTAMIDSGERLWLPVDRPTVDKHSTGGVGDKVTLVLAPLVAACGAAVPQLSGRGLGHTGGTLDKLESIPGWRANLSTAEMISQLTNIRAVVAAASTALAPADRKLYALRDVTATVESIPLIASSIMSKKIAAGPQSLVLDVKVGSGAFMKSREQAAELAQTMVEIGRSHGVATTALLTDMATPLGRTAGNAVEVAEAVDVLRGAGPDDVVELTLTLAREMLHLAGLPDVDLEPILASGQAYEVWCKMIRAQGGDPDAPLPSPKHIHVLEADDDGIVSEMDALAVGISAWRLGAGRIAPGATVQHAAGVRLLVTEGDRISSGQPLAELHTDTPDAVPAAVSALSAGIVISKTPPTRRPLVIDVIRG
ncbi:thymidine phosphorylase [Haloechinothrix halophila]|uniref:thymidine phosphorylase n=1 Tax=Haloechinothrix halophila TaxID=1069073 RepID=UPI000A06229C|nr:thymidine phosphorylase [Haloechinothrix halophila]